MNLFRLPVIPVCIAIFLAGVNLGAQAGRDRGPEVQLPLRRITIYSSGVSFFEHEGTLAGPAVLKIPFKVSALNDALKSLLLRDPASAFPQINYSPEQSQWETLRSLGIDLSGSPGITEILGGLRGEELEVSAPGPVTGRIMAVEYRRTGEGAEAVPWLSLLTPQGIRLFSLAEIGSLRFTRPGLNADLNRALDLIAGARNSQTRELAVSLSGSGSRPVSLSYVIPSPVWKVSYRLDLGERGAARFQGWAIVDNDSDADWRGVELSLAAGRPVSFIQNLYPPYYLNRPTLPLAIAGSAEALVWDSALDSLAQESMAYEPRAVNKAPAPQAAMAFRAAEAEPPPPPVSGADMADQFSFTVNTPVNLDRRTSAMFPLSNGEIEARKFLIFSGAEPGRTLHPQTGAELRNTTGLKLPAGPITIYDGGSYAGDALIEFFNPGEKRLISWGEDLSVTGALTFSSARTVTAVNLSGGVMTISRRQHYERKYRFKNSGEAKSIIIEHPITQGYTLAEPGNYDEATAGSYRFIRQLPEGGEAEFTSREEMPLSERITLVSLRPELLVSYSTSQEIPPAVRASLAGAVELRRKTEEAEKAWAETEARRNTQAAEQDRIRKNLEAAGNGTQQGQEYLRRLTSLDADIDRLNGDLERQRAEVRDAQAAFEAYLRALEF
ncbi:MAG: DUF4139 domain-containing protein [Treponema sp.]|jgi:hypothetical protein|nr:DUF4139 domain-containing protein [Treponema sp.]